KHGKPLIACSFDPTGRFLFTSSEDYTLQRWNLEDGSKVAWEAHDSWIRDIAFLPDGETVITAGCDDRIIFWPVAGERPQPRAEVVAHKGWVRSVDVNRDGTLIATGGNDHLVKLWDPNGKLVRELTGHQGHVYSVFFHPDGTTLLSGDLKGVVHQWDAKSGKLMRTFEAKELFSYNTGQKVDYGGVRDIALSPDGKTLAFTGLHKATNPLGAVNEPLVMLFDWAKGESIRKQPADGVRGIGWQVEFLSDGSEVCASGGGGGGYLIFFNSAEEKPFHQLKLKDTVRDMSLHPDGLQVATAHWDGYVRICRMEKKASK
ncbi:MAG: WD40 repeat domain-containing protein, partial [Planctomycetota bacterium]|nr:WD40 repeat domain-containing protein [Planctomycetota bacterium]